MEAYFTDAACPVGGVSARANILILDIGLPGMDGFEVLRRLRGDGMRNLT